MFETSKKKEIKRKPSAPAPTKNKETDTTTTTTKWFGQMCIVCGATGFKNMKELKEHWKESGEDKIPEGDYLSIVRRKALELMGVQRVRDFIELTANDEQREELIRWLQEKGFTNS